VSVSASNDAVPNLFSSYAAVDPTGKTLTLMVEGQPDNAYKVGESWQLPVGVVHDAKAGGEGAKVIVAYTVEKGQPLASPAK
jgi:hypothetical protein